MWFLSVQCGTDHYGDIVMQPKHIASQWWYPVPCINILYTVYIYIYMNRRSEACIVCLCSHVTWLLESQSLPRGRRDSNYKILFFSTYIYILLYSRCFPYAPKYASTVQQTSSKRAGASEAAVRLAAQASEPRRAAGLLVPWSRVLHGLEINSKTCQ